MINFDTELNIVHDWENGWSERQIARAHHVSRRTVRNITNNRPIERHIEKMRERYEREREYADTYEISEGLSKTDSRKLAKENQETGLKMRYDRRLEEEVFRRGGLRGSP